MSTVLEVAGLSKNFGALRATDDVTLDVQEGDVYLLEREGEGAFGPYDLKVRKAPRR